MIKNKNKQGKKSWNIGKIGEKKTREFLNNNNYFHISTSVDEQGIDHIAFKDGIIYLIETKATYNIDKKWKEAFSLSQRKKYWKIKEEIEKQGFTVYCLLFYWKKENNRWKLEIINF